MQKVSRFFLILDAVEWVEQVVNEQKLWINIVKRFGANTTEAKDIVQNMYIRLIEYSSKEKVIINGNINHIYIYWALRNTYLNYIKKHRNYTEQPIEENQPQQASYKGNSTWSNIFKRYNSTDSYEERKIYGIEQNKKKSFEDIIQKINEEIETWHWYDIMIFQEYIKTGKSIRTLAKQSKISKDSIFQTLKNCKAKLKEKVGEDWEDFKNEDFDKIKLKNQKPDNDKKQYF